jgi:hypothetical protein
MRYRIKEDGRGGYSAVITDTDGRVLSRCPCCSEAQAIVASQAAMAAGWREFPAGMELPPDPASQAPQEAPAPAKPKRSRPAKAKPAVPPAFAKFDHDGDGHPGGSLPKAKRKPKKAPKA